MVNRISLKKKGVIPNFEQSKKIGMTHENLKTNISQTAEPFVVLIHFGFAKCIKQEVSYLHLK